MTGRGGARVVSDRVVWTFRVVGLLVVGARGGGAGFNVVGAGGRYSLFTIWTLGAGLESTCLGEAGRGGARVGWGWGGGGDRVVGVRVVGTCRVVGVINGGERDDCAGFNVVGAGGR